MQWLALAIGIIGVAFAILPSVLDKLGVVFPRLLLYILLFVAVGLVIISIGLMVYGLLWHFLSRIRFRSPVFLANSTPSKKNLAKAVIEEERRTPQVQPRRANGDQAIAGPTGVIAPYFFQRLNVPAVLLEGDGLYEYRVGMLQPRWQPEPYELENLPEALRLICARILEEKKRITDEQALVLFNGRLARLFEYRPFRDDVAGLRRLELRIQPTDYYTFLATNHALESSLTSEAKRAGLVAVESLSITNLRESILANPITVTINIITSEPDGTERLLVQRRNTNKVMHCWQKWQAGAAGMVSSQPDPSSSIPDPFFTAAVHEVKQETGIEVADKDIIFLALARETRFFEVGLLGEVRVRRSYSELLESIEDPFEADEFVSIPFTPQDFVRFLRQIGRQELGSPAEYGKELEAGINSYVPLALTAAVLSLAHKCGDVQPVENAFTQGES